MVFNQKIASLGLTGFFGAVFIAAAPPLSAGLFVTYGVMSAALGFGIAAISKAVGDAFPDQATPVPLAGSDVPPPPYSGDGLPPVNPQSYSAPIITPVPVRQPFFGNLFSKPAHKLVDRHLEPSRPHSRIPSAPFMAVRPHAVPTIIPARTKPASSVISHTVERHQDYPIVTGVPHNTVTPPVTFRKHASVAAPIVSHDASRKPVSTVVDHRVVPAGQPGSDKPAPKIVGRSIQRH